MKTSVHSVIDQYDHKIIKIMAQNARISVTALAEQIGLSKTPTMHRLRRLETEGYITAYQARLNYDLLGESHIAFIQITLSDTSLKALESFNHAVQKLSAVEQCHMIAGNFDYLLKVRTRDIQSYRQFLGEELVSLPYVSHTSTFVAMETVCDRQKAAISKNP